MFINAVQQISIFRCRINEFYWLKVLALTTGMA